VILEPQFRLAHGDHACLFYQSDDSLTQALLHFCIDGLQKGERCLCTQKPHIVKRLRTELRRAGVDVEKEIERGGLALGTAADRYLRDGEFRPVELVETLKGHVQASSRDGFSGFRTSGDLSGMTDTRIKGTQFIDYERLVSECYPSSRLTSMCVYSADSLPSRTRSSITDIHSVKIVDPRSPSAYSWIQIKSKGYVAEVITDKFVERTSFSYIVRRLDSQDVLRYGDKPTFDSARAEAEEILRSFAAKGAKNTKT
jgi:hypothetical protein